jgi:hypothetical protein
MPLEGGAARSHLAELGNSIAAITEQSSAAAGAGRACCAVAGTAADSRARNDDTPSKKS